MANRPLQRVGLLVALILLAAACSRPPERAPERALPKELDGTAGAPLTPYDLIDLPVDHIPEPSPRTTFHPEFQDPGTGALVEVLRVLDDPREIPLDRWLVEFPGGDSVTLYPQASKIRSRFESAQPMPLAVYVKVQNPSDTSVEDPFFPSGDISENPSDAWPPMDVIDPGSDLRLPCSALDYVEATEAYPAPDTDEVVDPRSYTPPRPWYEPDRRIDPGETREGWMLCLSTVPARDAQLEWRTMPEAASDSAAMVVWSRLDRLPVGGWHFIENAQVLAWSLEDGAEEGPSPPPGPGATPTGAIPAEGAQRVYEGPVWISVGIGMSYTQEVTGPRSGSPMTFDVAGVSPPGDCPGTGVWYRHQEPYEVICHPNSDGRYGRFSLQFYFPGMEEYMAEWGRMALQDRVSLELYAQDDLDGLIASFDGVEVQSEFTWLEADLPDEVDKVWLALTEPGETYVAPLPIWEVDLYYADFGSSSTEAICADWPCLDLDELTMNADDREALRLKMAVPILDLGEEGHGITIHEASTVDRTILVNDNLHGQDFLPQKRGDPWLIVEISTVTDRAGDIYLLYPSSDGIYRTEPLELVALYEGSGGEIAVRYGVHAEVRGAEQGFALLGSIPRGVSLGEAYLVLSNAGPAWRLR